jgi:hypothetical protein
MRKLPSPWSIVCTDNVCWAIATTAPFVFLLALVIKITGTIPGSRGRPDTPLDPGVASLVLAGAVALVLFLSAIVMLRVSRFRGLFDGGREVEASVRNVKHMRGARTQLKLEFRLEGILYTVRCTFLRSSRTPAFDEGARIPLLVDPLNPKRAVPLALYAGSGPARSARSGGRPVSTEQQSGIRLKSRG